ncbi:hypothetical protein E2C01_052062 [Portunus trituberculatus]|uniref:Secreted protein n=1 Tax=Portunus trituberculatus TaxID=210409 RepID=A0A5B7GLC4_PORTR|nr:hypothetical protein [Portunus trituberculatus]
MAVRPPRSGGARDGWACGSLVCVLVSLSQHLVGFIITTHHVSGHHVCGAGNGGFSAPPGGWVAGARHSLLLLKREGHKTSM